MDNLLDKVILDNRVRDYIVVFASIFVIYILKKFFSKPLARIIIAGLRIMGKDVDQKAFVDLILDPLESFLVILASVVAFSTLNFPTVLFYKFYRSDTHSAIDTLALAIVILNFFWVLLRIVDYLALVMEKKADLTPGQGDNQLVIFFKDFLKVIIVIAGILTVIKFAFKYQITELLTGLGIVGAALALSARESLENLIASFIIFFDKPFAVGDNLKVQNITGTVEKIGLRSTRIRTNEKTYVSVPNKQMVDSIVDNLSLRTQRRVDLKLDANLNSSSEQIQSLLDGLKTVMKHPRIEKSHVYLNDISQQAFSVNVEYYTAPIAIEEFNQVKQEINMAAIRLMEKLGIEISGANTDVRIVNESVSSGR
ncbi:MAG: hypothetical protein C5B52_06140 [Bacteroidetes bacterium]|nr:MAG: hypothetical protein C5B52_06140 [Bacteroidota bacterium]